MSISAIGNKDLQTALYEVLRRSAVDPQFRTLATKDGNAALKQINPKLPADITVRFLEKANASSSGLTLGVVLPEAVAEGHTLSEADLEQVAGGAAPGVHASNIED